jgi:hypothetical protein
MIRKDEVSTKREILQDVQDGLQLLTCRANFALGPVASDRQTLIRLSSATPWML